MNTSLFIARRIVKDGQKSFSRLIIRIAVVAVALSVAVMIISSALISGFKQEIGQKIFGFWGHIHISDTNYSLSFEPEPIEKNQSFYPSLAQTGPIKYIGFKSILGFETEQEVERTTYGGIKHIQVFAHKPGIIRTKTAMEGIILKGVGEDFDWGNMMPYMLEGRGLQKQLADSTDNREIIISKQTADRLQVKVGDKFIVYFIKEGEQLKRRFQVCGIYKTGLEEYDLKFAICDIKSVQQLLGWKPNQVAGFEVWLADLRDLAPFNDYIYTEKLPDKLLSVSIREKFPAIFEWLALQDYNEVVILGLMLAVAIINMITALLVLVLERSTMIGILKSLGESNRNIRHIFLYHAAVITGKGMFWGNLIGLGFCFLQSKFHLIKLNEADYYLAYAPVSINWWVLIGINISTLLITLFFLLLPSLAVSVISPLRAIQFK
jgi:lipoprotein-releasing system permease protein